MTATAEPIGILQLLDTLDPGGMERVAVNIANDLPRDRYESHLGTTRWEGALANQVAPHVPRLRLDRRSRFDCGALRRLNAYIAEHRIGVLHAHSTSLFLALAASCFGRRPKVIWHDHSGGFRDEKRSVWIYRLAAWRLGGVIAVNQALADWSRVQLRLPADRVWYIRNFVCPPSSGAPAPDLPGVAGSRIVCVANLRPAKDHPNLLRAFERVRHAVPAAQLLLVGRDDGENPAYVAQVRHALAEPGGSGQVTWLGPRNDVPAVLRGCDIGVLSSAYEGMPMSLIEYGMAGLATVCTQVGQCPEVLDEGRAGLLVPPGNAEALAEALIRLLRASDERATLGRAFQQRAQATYSAEQVIQQICRAYERVLSAAGKTQPAAFIGCHRF